MSTQIFDNLNEALEMVVKASVGESLLAHPAGPSRWMVRTGRAAVGACDWFLGKSSSIYTTWNIVPTLEVTKCMEPGEVCSTVRHLRDLMPDSIELLEGRKHEVAFAYVEVYAPEFDEGDDGISEPVGWALVSSSDDWPRPNVHWEDS